MRTIHISLAKVYKHDDLNWTITTSQKIKMKVLVSFFVLCALTGNIQARFETIFGDIEDHEFIGLKKAFIESDPGVSNVGMNFKFPPVRTIIPNTYFRYHLIKYNN